MRYRYGRGRIIGAIVAFGGRSCDVQRLLSRLVTMVEEVWFREM